MSQQAEKYLNKSEVYKGVYTVINPAGHKKWYYKLTINGVKFRGCYDTEYECAKQYDIKLIENGRKPVNVLKPKL